MQYGLSQFRSVISEEIEDCRYADLEDKYGVNRYYLWHIIHDENYQPPAKVLDKLEIVRFELAPVCSACGEVHAIDRACEKTVIVKHQTKKLPPRYQFGWLMSFYETKEWAEIIHNEKTITLEIGE